jgi:hypothetical protein
VSRENDAKNRLREAIDAFAAEQAPQLVEEAGAEALARARRALAETMTEALLERSGEALAPSPPDRRRPPAPEDGEPASYVYGVVAPSIELPADLGGVDPDHSVFLVEEGGIAALVSRVSTAEFGEEPLHENLNDVAWLEEKARAHEHVLDVALRHGTVVPLRLCTIYSDDDHVREMLVREGAVMMEALDRLDGRAEWGVKAIAAPQALERAARPEDEGPAQEEAARGTEYMKRKRDEARARDDEEEIADRWASEIHDRLEAAASEALVNPLQNPEVSGYDGDMLLNGVYLLEDAAVEGFGALVDSLAKEYRDRGVSVELTGPWPPYNFVKGSIESAR